MSMTAESCLSGKRSGPLMAIGVINLVVGIVAIVGALLIVFLLPGLERDLGMARNHLAGTGDAQLAAAEAELSGMAKVMWPLMRVFSVAMLGLGCVLVVASLGLLRMRPWARSMSLGLAWLMIAWAGVSFGYSVLSIPLAGPSPKAFTPPFDAVYWIVVAVVLMSRDTRARFASAEAVPVPPPAPLGLATPI